MRGGKTCLPSPTTAYVREPITPHIKAVSMPYVEPPSNDWINFSSKLADFARSEQWLISSKRVSRRPKHEDMNNKQVNTSLRANLKQRNACNAATGAAKRQKRQKLTPDQFLSRQNAVTSNQIYAATHDTEIGGGSQGAGLRASGSITERMKAAEKARGVMETATSQL